MRQSPASPDENDEKADDDNQEDGDNDRNDDADADWAGGVAGRWKVGGGVTKILIRIISTIVVLVTRQAWWNAACVLA